MQPRRWGTALEGATARHSLEGNSFSAAEYGHDCMQLPFPSDAAPLELLLRRLPGS